MNILDAAKTPTDPTPLGDHASHHTCLATAMATDHSPLRRLGAQEEHRPARACMLCTSSLRITALCWATHSLGGWTMSRASFATTVASRRQASSLYAFSAHARSCLPLRRLGLRAPAARGDCRCGGCPRRSFARRNPCREHALGGSSCSLPRRRLLLRARRRGASAVIPASQITGGTVAVATAMAPAPQMWSPRATCNSVLIRT